VAITFVSPTVVVEVSGDSASRTAAIVMGCDRSRPVRLDPCDCSHKGLSWFVRGVSASDMTGVEHPGRPAGPEVTGDGIQPSGAMVAVVSSSPEGPRYLLLHSAEGNVGDWEWGSPSRCIEPGEGVAECAARELLEETGIDGEPKPVVTQNIGWAVFFLDVPWGTRVKLSHEHDDFAWVSLGEAHRLCRPERQAESFRLAVNAIAAQ
jgi:8-oxo-dGTP pyrophosphatase MutT (NUDIX family)